MQNENNQEMISYFVHESEMARLERMVKRMWILCIIMFLALVITNAGWVYYESQFEDVVTTVTQDLDTGIGGDAVINDGVHINGESQAISNDKDQKTENGR